MSLKQTSASISDSELDRLANVATDVIARCKKAGASAAEVGVSVSTGLNVNVRMGEVETLEYSRDRGVSVTVHFGGRKASASTGDIAPESIIATVEQACAIAKFTEEDPFAGLADADRMATVFSDLDLWHPWQIDAEGAIEIAKQCEDAARAADSRISNSEGANVNSAKHWSVYANSHGFVGPDRGTRQSVSCSLIAGENSGMQRDYWYSSARSAQDLESAEQVGITATQRTVARLGARGLSTRKAAVLFVPELARGLIASLINAVTGGSQYRKSTFLLDHAGKQVLPNWFAIDEDPFILRGSASGAFDAEGVATQKSALVSDGVLQHYVMSSYSARKLGLQSTGNAGGVHNLLVKSSGQNLKQLMADMGTGLMVTDVMGQGVNGLTGDYSRGAGGFWIENGEIAFPVEEITIAGNLREMLMGIQAVGNDVDQRSHILTGSILVDRMTIAGE